MEEEFANGPVEPESEEKSLSLLTTEIKAGLHSEIKKRKIARYADEALQLIEEYQTLEKHYKIYGEWIKRLEAGDYEVLKEYKKKRNRLEDEDNFEL